MNETLHGFKVCMLLLVQYVILLAAEFITDSLLHTSPFYLPFDFGSMLISLILMVMDIIGLLIPTGWLIVYSLNI